jgi:UDP-N-acetylmuramoyl-L-alanyl-D-glutamate--2,6-diaminopimelate ligase
VWKKEVGRNEIHAGTGCLVEGKMRISDIVEFLKLVDIKGNLETEFNGIASDSRTLVSGEIFFALDGYRSSGNLFVDEAIEKGASAIVTEGNPGELTVPVIRVTDIRNGMGRVAHRYYGQPSHSMICTGITGTNGKTTTSYLVDAILRQRYDNTAVMGTLGMVSGGSHRNFGLTTPESTDIASEFAHLKDSGCRAVTMEVSSHGLALGRVAGIEFDVAIFTNLSRDHLDFHDDMDNYLEVKLSLFCELGMGGKRSKGIINIDDPREKSFRDATPTETFTYSISREEADVKATEYRLDHHGSDVTIRSPLGETRLHLKLPGKFNISNALAGFTAGLALDMDQEEIVRGLESVKGVRGRMEMIEGKGLFIVIDYAHTPEALENLLLTLDEIFTGKLITVVGCGGERDVEKRPMMGEVAARFSHKLVITSDNPRGEDPEVILDHMEEGVKRIRDDFTRLTSREEAIRFAVDQADKGDTVVIAGKGHEDYQIIGQERHRFDDREVARRVLGITDDQVTTEGDVT